VRPTSIRLPPALEESVRQAASDERRSFSAMLVLLVERGLQEDFPRALNVTDAQGYTVAAGTNPPPPDKELVPYERGRARTLAERGEFSGKCTAYAPRGTRCKLCGKTHP